MPVEPPTFDTVRHVALALPDVTDGTSYRTPALYVRKKLLARLHEDGDTLIITIPHGEREWWIQADPDTFFIMDHYVPYPKLLVRLSRVQREDLATLIRLAWHEIAPKRLVRRAVRDAGDGGEGSAC